jgi:hypothetical protein
MRSGTPRRAHAPELVRLEYDAGGALQKILDLSNDERDKTVKTLDDVLQKSRKF